MTLRRGTGPMLAVLFAALAAGCASMASKPGPSAAGVPPATTTPGHPNTGTTHTGTTPSTAPGAAAIDSTAPSAAAQSVLARIPEPLTPAQQALNASQASTDTSHARGMAIAPAAAYDSLQAAPVPAPTQPLGTESSTVTMADSTGAGAGATASSTGSGAVSTGAGATSSSTAGAATGAAVGAAAGATAATAGKTSADTTTSGPCWRLQVGAPLASEQDKADSRREAAQSQLMTQFTIVPEKGYLKVRTSDCMSRDDADALKKRAIESGFGDAFLIDTNAAPPAQPTATKHQHVPASKRKK